MALAATLQMMALTRGHTQVLDSLADPISAVLKKKPKENASPQDVERHNELQRCAMVTVCTCYLAFNSAQIHEYARLTFAWQVVHLNKVNDSNTCHKFLSMFDAIQQDPKLRCSTSSRPTHTHTHTPTPSFVSSCCSCTRLGEFHVFI